MFEFSLFAAVNEAAAGSAAHFNWTYVGKHAFNLAVLVGALAFILRKPLSGFMKSRRRGMSERFEESGRKLARAKEIFEERSGKLANLKTEIDLLKSRAAEQAQAERRSILRRAEEEKEAILKELDESLELAASRAGAAVRTEAVAAAVKAAEESLRGAPDGAAAVRTFQGAVKDGKLEGKWLRSQN